MLEDLFGVCMAHGGNNIAQNTVHGCTLFNEKDSFLIRATGNETSNEEGVSYI